MQDLMVLAAVAVAALFVGKRLWQTFRSRQVSSCGCSCSGCDRSNANPQDCSLPRPN